MAACPPKPPREDRTIKTCPGRPPAGLAHHSQRPASGPPRFAPLMGTAVGPRGPRVLRSSAWRPARPEARFLSCGNTRECSFQFPSSHQPENFTFWKTNSSLNPLIRRGSFLPLHQVSKVSRSTPKTNPCFFSP